MATAPVPRSTIAGVLYEDDFLPGADRVFDWALTHVPWDQRIRARKTASYGEPYNYAGLTYPRLDFPPELEQVRARVSERLATPYNNCLLNYYPDGGSRMGFHSDSAEGIVEGAGVVIVSLGAARALRFRRTAQKDDRVDYLLAPGSLLFMAPEVQRLWEHALPRTSRDAPRVSLTFRAVRR